MEQTKELRTGAATGVLEGRVRLAPGEALPAYASGDLARRPLEAEATRRLPDACAAAQRDALHPVALTSEGLLSGIVVAASDFTHFSRRTPIVHRVSIEHCRLQPSLVAAMGGDLIDLENRDAFAFAPLVGPSFLARPLAHGQHLRVPATPGEVESMLCSRDAPCGRTDLVVFHHPVFAVTDAHGTFRIPKFPAGEMVRITAWHPLFEESETFVWLQPGERSATELLLTPRKRFVAHASADTPPAGLARSPQNK